MIEKPEALANFHISRSSAESQTDLDDMGTLGELFRKMTDKGRRKILVEKELQATSISIRRSRSAAKDKAAKISSRSR